MKTKQPQAVTPWPWIAKQSTLHHGDYFIMREETPDPGTRLLKRVDHQGIFSEADARLIAAAPELLEAAQYFVSIIGSPQGYSQSEISVATNKLRAAILKAQGEGR